MKLILASNSKTRKDILDRMGLRYEVSPSNIEENSNKTDPREYVMDLSRQKGNVVSSNVKEGVILSADSIIYIDDKKIEKTKTKEDAKNMLRLFSGRVNHAITGVTIIDKYQDKIITFSEVTDVYFNDITDDEIDWYIEHEEHILERCGYSLAGKAFMYIPKINGDYYNVLGLPISRIYDELKKLGYEISDFN